MTMAARRFSRSLLLALLASSSAARAWGQPAAPRQPATTAPAPDSGVAPPAPPPEALPPETAPPSDAPPPAAVPPPEASPPLPAPFAPPEPEETPVVVMPAHEPVSRPRLSAGVGFGGTFDSVGFRDNSAHLIPAFVAVLGIGDGLLYGVDLGAFASQASGRHPDDLPVDRLALDAYGVLRPLARYHPGDDSYQMRVGRTLAAELGLGLEREGRSNISGTRFAVHTGARVDLPLSPASEPTELRLRFAVRRAIGLYTPTISSRSGADLTRVGDSAAELYVALVMVF
jgi:hypothetical protein